MEIILILSGSISLLITLYNLKKLTELAALMAKSGAAQVKINDDLITKGRLQNIVNKNVDQTLQTLKQTSTER